MMSIVSLRVERHRPGLSLYVRACAGQDLSNLYSVLQRTTIASYTLYNQVHVRRDGDGTPH